MTRTAGRIVVVGAGAWGTTLAIVAHRAGAAVTLVSSHAATVERLQSTRTHPRSLPGVELPERIHVTESTKLEPGSEDVVFVAIPVQQLEVALASLPALGHGVGIVSVAKGIEVSTLRRPSEILREAYPASRVAVLSGPNIASEIAAGSPATAVVASADASLASNVQQSLSSASFRVYTGEDVIGVELGGALKNIIAIGAGIADGLHAGHNAKAAFMTRGIGEIARLGIALGAQPLTFAGLSGIGDLIATCGSPASRNHQVGQRLAEGASLSDIRAAMIETAEGIETTRAAWQLARRLDIETPIIDGMYRVLFEGASPVAEALMLMQRDPTHEHP
jgi:glycerol-3-phosphate dehydrogenase (NAD(P)+)